jgi:signal transduction histidine kinase
LGYRPSTGHTCPTADTHSACVRLSSATLEPELRLRRRTRRARDVLHREAGLELEQSGSGPELHGHAQDTFDQSRLMATLLIGVAALGSTLLLSRWIVGPVERLNEQARRLGKGEENLQLDTRRGDELGELGRTMTQLAEQLSRTEDLRRSLVHDVAHELRTPLTVLRGQIEALVQKSIWFKPAPSIREISERWRPTLVVRSLTSDSESCIRWQENEPNRVLDA